MKDIVHDHRIGQNRTGIPQYKYDEATKLACLAVYAETLNIAEASRATGIPQSTINGWLKQEDTDTLLDDLRFSIRRSVAFKCAQVATQAIESIAQRLSEGDPHVGKDGEIIYKPVNARDSAAIFSIVVDKHTLLTAGQSQMRTVDKRLSALADDLTNAINKLQTVSTVSPSDYPGNSPEIDGVVGET